MTEYVRTAKTAIATKTAAVLTLITVTILSSSLAPCIAVKIRMNLISTQDKDSPLTQ